jgi:hypothetical protein
MVKSTINTRYGFDYPPTKFFAYPFYEDGSPVIYENLADCKLNLKGNSNFWFEKPIDLITLIVTGRIPLKKAIYEYKDNNDNQLAAYLNSTNEAFDKMYLLFGYEKI